VAPGDSGADFSRGKRKERRNDGAMEVNHNRGRTIGFSEVFILKRIKVIGWNICRSDDFKGFGGFFIGRGECAEEIGRKWGGVFAGSDAIRVTGNYNTYVLLVK
jgi:hypothetical protein